MSDTNGALLSAVITALEAAITGVKVYTRVPPSAALPYISVDSTLAVNADVLSDLRDDTRVYLTIWTAERGSKRANEIIGQVYDTLHRSRLSLSEGTMIRAFVEARGTEPDIADDVHKGRVTLRFLIAH